MEIIINIISLYFIKKTFNRKKILTNFNAKKNLNGENSNGKISRFKKADLNAQIMVFVMCFISFIEHFCMIIAVLYFQFRKDYLGEILGFTADFSIAIKHFSNFFVFYLFNKNLRKILNKWFEKKILVIKTRTSYT